MRRFGHSAGRVVADADTGTDTGATRSPAPTPVLTKLRRRPRRPATFPTVTFLTSEHAGVRLLAALVARRRHGAVQPQRSSGTSRYALGPCPRAVESRPSFLASRTRSARRARRGRGARTRSRSRAARRPTCSTPTSCPARVVIRSRSTRPNLGAIVNYPSWYPDATALAIVDYGSTPGAPAGTLKRIAADGSSTTVLTDLSQIYAGEPAVSPDGNTIAFPGQPNDGMPYNQDNNRLYLLPPVASRSSSTPIKHELRTGRPMARISPSSRRGLARAASTRSGSSRSVAVTRNRSRTAA